VYEELKERIISADLLPGQEINILDLSKSLGVSTMPVREALRQLDSDQIVIIQNNRSSRINELAQDGFDEILQIRLNIETVAAKKACELRTDSDIHAIEKIVTEMQKTGDNLKQYIRKNRELHFGIYELANSPILLNIIDKLWARVGPYFNLQIFAKKHLDEFLVSHMEMYEALKNKDKTRMAQALKNDLQRAAERIRPLLRKSD
jgi:DNA-binding GntR family transcriptional regulator